MSFVAVVGLVAWVMERVLAKEEACSVFVRDRGKERKKTQGEEHTQHEIQARESPLHPPTCLYFLLDELVNALIQVRSLLTLLCKG